MKFYTRHPIYEVLEDLKINTPKVSSDIGRFPEYFLIRTIIPYLVELERIKNYKSFFCHEIFRSSDDLKKILPEEIKDSIDGYPHELNKKKDPERFNRIIKKCKDMLLNHLKQGSQIYERKKATIFWYFRETLRFGSHSRLTMMYDRVSLEYIGEALVVAFLIEKKMNLKKTSVVIKMKKHLEEIVDLHQKYCSLIHKNNYDKSDIDKYDSKLKALKGSI